MATDLYETLELSKDATPEEIRKAYKKKALKTHPDRLPPGASPAEKAESEEQFRRVNNAYEVLNDAQNRRVYDLHGVWPPPEPELEEPPRRTSPNRYRDYTHRHHASRNNLFQDPFFQNPRMFSNFVFTDPFTLFDSIFGDYPQQQQQHHHQPHHHHHHHHHRSRSLRPEDPFERARRMHMEIGSFMSNIDRDIPPVFPGGFAVRSRFPASSANPHTAESTSYPSRNHRWVEESHMTSTVNGITQSIRKRRDWEGNEHVTRTYPDGREVHTINGIEQPSSSHGFSLPHYTNESHAHLPPPPIVGQLHNSGSRPDYVVPPPPPYPAHSGAYNSPPPAAEYERRRDRRYSDSRPVVPDIYSSSAPVIPSFDRQHEDHQQRKRWWRGGW